MTTRTSGGIYLQVLEPAAAVATGIEIDVYDAANYATMLDTLEGARNTSYQKQLNQAGAGTFKINRHDAKATAQNTQKGNLCKVKIDGVYRGAFFMEETCRDYADPSGAGVEDSEIKGRGVLAYLERAVVYPTGWPATKLPDVTYTGVTRGAILKDQIDQAKARGGLGAMTYDFTATVDSIGNPWTDTNTLTLHIGLNLFDLTLQLAALGTDFYMDPWLGFHAYQSLSIDRTGASGAAAVVFRQGKHVGQKALTVDEHNSAVRSRLLVEGSGNNIQEVVDIPIETDATVGRREGYLSYTSSGDTQALNDAGEALMQQMAADAQPLSMTVTHGLSSDGTGEYEPFVDYDVGDYALVDVPGAYDLAALRLVGLTIDQIEGGDYVVTGDFNSVYLEYLIRVGQKTSGLTGGSSGSGSAPGGGGAPAAGAGRVAAAVGDAPGYLFDKITAGVGITKTLTGSAPAETVTLAAIAPAPAVTSGRSSLRKRTGTLTKPFYQDRSVVAAAGTGQYNALGDLAITARGEPIAVYRRGASHTSQDGIINFARSSDGGITSGGWTTITIASPAAGHDLRDPAICTTLTGRLVVDFVDYVDSGSPSYTIISARAKVMYSDDDGATWSSPVDVTQFTTWVIPEATILQHSSGALVMAVYGQNTGDTGERVAVMFSTDDGATWATPQVYLTAANSNYSETALVELADASILAIMRNDNTGQPLPFGRVISHDAGATWSSVSSLSFNVQNGRPGLLLFPASQQLMLFYRRTGDHFAAFRYSNDGGTTWSSETLWVSDVYVYAGGKASGDYEVAMTIAYEVGSGAQTDFWTFTSGSPYPVPAHQARAHASAGQTVAHDVVTKLTLDVADFDLAGWASSAWTVPATGRYEIKGYVTDGTTTTTESYLSIFVNSAERSRGDDTPTGSTNYGTFAVAETLALAVGDVVDLRVFQSSGGNVTYSGGGVGASRLSIVRVA